MNIQNITIKPSEALFGTKRLITRKGKRLEVAIPPGVKTGTLVKLSGALRITDGFNDDLYIRVNVRNTRNIVFTAAAAGLLCLVIILTIVLANPISDKVPAAEKARIDSAVVYGGVF
ncbi:MAG: DnaJ C-terminal domain-containing protein [Dehalococcoidales bacterium]|jgi:DnaJ-class molecular chaperone